MITGTHSFINQAIYSSSSRKSDFGIVCTLSSINPSKMISSEISLFLLQVNFGGKHDGSDFNLWKNFLRFSLSKSSLEAVVKDKEAKDE